MLLHILILIICVIGNNKPTIKLLMNYEGKIAPRWYALGMQLLEEKYVHQIYIIQKNYPTDIRKCCAKMFQYWLEVDTGASWDKLIKALEKIEQISLAEDIKKGRCTYIIFRVVCTWLL